MTGWELALLWCAWVIAGGSPGPATLSIAGTAMGQGRRAALVFSFGILAGSATLGLAAALGMGAVMLANAWVVEIIRYVGAAYLMWLAVKSLRSALRGGAATMPEPVANRGLFLRGLLIHLTNPKAIFSWGAVFAVTLPEGAGLTQVMGMFAFLFAGSLIVFPGYALLFSTPAMVAVYARLRRAFETVFGLLFGAASLSILTARLT